jgi:N-acetylglucosaminyldiphosphoundecaprenol N-acetyl-beta-D-mannosaminyltransferase
MQSEAPPQPLHRHQADVLGCPIDAVTMRETIACCEVAIESRRRLHQVSVNAAKLIAIRQDERLREIVKRSGLVNADGQSIVWASRLLGSPLPERVAGIDLMFELLASAEAHGYRVYIVGARPEVLKRAVCRLEELYPRLVLCGWHHGYFTEADEGDLVRSIASTEPDIVLVAMSSPRKEYWLAEHGDDLRAPVQVGVGGSIDVVAGVTRRAPRWMQSAGLEWLYRMVQEPMRLVRRYASTNAQFVALLASEVVRNQLSYARGRR